VNYYLVDLLKVNSQHDLNSSFDVSLSSLFIDIFFERIIGL